MSIVYPQAVIKPGKIELVTTWLHDQDWYSGEPDQRFKRVGSYRFDDPDGEVGIETILVRGQVDGQIYQVPMTYRGAELVGGRLMTTMEHSVLGLRYIYEGPSDPVFVQAFTTAMLERGHETEQIISGGDNHGVSVPSGVQVRGSGPLGEVAQTEVVVPHLLPSAPPSDAVATLAGYWTDGSDPVAWLVGV